MTERRRPSRRWVVLGGAAAVLVVWGAAVAVSLFHARDDVASGLDSIRAAQRLTAPADLVRGRPLPHLRDSRAAFRRAERRLDGLLVAPLRLLPIVGRQVRSTSALAGTAAEVSDVGVDVVTSAQRALGRPHGTGAERIALLRELAALAADAEGRLVDLDLGPSRALVRPLADKRAEVVERLDDVRDALRDGRTVAGGLADLLQGPRRYLVLAANNSEMRAGSGMFLSVGELAFADGGFDLGELRPSGDLYVAADPPPIADADYAARWGWLNPNKEWRNLGLSPRFDATAALAARMWQATGGAPVAGVLALDPLALQAVLRATGPVTVEGRQVGADNVADLLLHEQYVGITSRAEQAQAGRREQLGLIAKATLDALEQGSWDTATLASELATAARGRHLLGWAAGPVEQEVWTNARIDGRLGDDSLLLAVLNRGGNKLDRFLDVQARLGFRPAGNKDETAAELRVTLENRTPPGESLYIEGPFPDSGVGAGDYVGLVSVDFPAFAGAITVEGAGPPAAAGADGPARVLAVPVQVDRGRTVELTFRFTLGARTGALTVEPTARVPAVSWTAPGGSWTSGEARRVAW